MGRSSERLTDVARARGCAFTGAVGVSLPATFLAVVWLSYGLSWWSRSIALGCALAAAGMLARALSMARGTKLILIGGTLAVAPLIVRMVSVHGADGVDVVTLPRDTGSHALKRIYPEPDGTVAAAMLLQWTGGLRDPEASRFAEILAQAYERTLPDAASLPTPAVNTYLALQRPEAFDVIVVRPERGGSSEAGVVFLHGYAGNFYVYCWEFAQAASAARLVTLCPSLDASGAWWTKRGHDVLEITLDHAKDLGIRRIYLAGLSNGAAGAATLAAAFERRLSGLVLVSGVAAARVPELPVLIVQGSADAMMTAERSRAYAARSPNARYHEIEGGHLIFLSKHRQVRPLIAAFLRDLERRASPRP